jgi:polyisoprenoid-binding protein YceI
MRILTLFALLAAAPSPSTFGVAQDRSTLRYTVKHKLHEVSAEAHKLEAKALLKPDGAAQVMVRARVADFLSGDGNRDEHMQETMEATRFPTVTFKGVGKLAMPAAFPGAAELTLDGELELHGRKARVQVPVALELPSAGEARVKGDLHVSLDAYGIERPSLLLVPIDDDCEVQFDLVLVRE